MLIDISWTLAGTIIVAAGIIALGIGLGAEDIARAILRDHIDAPPR